MTSTSTNSSGNGDSWDVNDHSIGGIWTWFALQTIVTLAVITLFGLLQRSRVFRHLVTSTRQEILPSETLPVITSTSPFGWLKETWSTPETFILANLGLDAVLFLRFLKRALIFFTACACIVIPILVPINYFAFLPQDDDSHNGTPQDTIHRLGSVGLSRFTIANVPPQNPLLYAHVLLAYIVTFGFCFMVWQSLKDFVQLSNECLTVKHTKQSALELKQLRTVMVMNLPTQLSSDTALQEYFESLRIGEVETCHVSLGVGTQLSSLIHERERVIVKLENAYMQWFKNVEAFETGVSGCSLHSLTRRVKRWFGYASARREATPLEIERLRPKHSKVVVGHAWRLWRRRTMVDSMNAYTNTLNSLSMNIKNLRHLYMNTSESGSRPSVSSSTTTGFVTFKSQKSALIAAQTVIAPFPFDKEGSLISEHVMKIVPAPAPNDVIWNNLTISPVRKQTQRWIVTLTFLALCFFWTIPTTFIASFANLDALGRTRIFKSVIADLAKSPKLYAFIQNILPPVIVSLVLVSVPSIIRLLGDWDGIEAHTWKQKKSLSRYFTFLFFSVFFTFALSSAIFQLVVRLVDNPVSIIGLLATIVPKGTTFFINYTLYMTTWNAIELLRPMVLLQHLWSKWVAVTPRDMFELSRATSHLDYGIYYPYHILFFVIVLSYSIISPPVLLAAIPYFLISYIVYKYQLIFVYIKQHESYGTHYFMAMKRLFAGLLVCQSTLMGVLSLKAAIWQSTLMIPLLVFSGWMFRNVVRVFDKRCKYPPLQNVTSQTEIMGPSIIDAETQLSAHLIEELDEEEYWHPTGLESYIHPAFSQKLMKPWLPGAISLFDPASASQQDDTNVTHDTREESVLITTDADTPSRTDTRRTNLETSAWFREFQTHCQQQYQQDYLSYRSVVNSWQKCSNAPTSSSAVPCDNIAVPEHITTTYVSEEDWNDEAQFPQQRNRYLNRGYRRLSRLDEAVLRRAMATTGPISEDKGR